MPYIKWNGEYVWFGPGAGLAPEIPIGTVNITSESINSIAEQIAAKDKDWFQKVSEGLVPGYSIMEKFGEAPSVTTSTDPADVWEGSVIEGAEIYTFSTSADIDRLSSSAIADTMDVLVIGLDSDWNEVEQTVTLDGRTPVALDTSLIRIHRMIIRGSSSLQGMCYCFVDSAVTDGVPDDETKIRAIVNNGNNQTLMAIYTVPAGKTGYFWGGYVSMATGSNQSQIASFTWRARLFGEVFAVKSKIQVSGDGNSSWDYEYKTAVPLPEKTDILIRCDEVSANMGVSGGFTVILKDNE